MSDNLRAKYPDRESLPKVPIFESWHGDSVKAMSDHLKSLFQERGIAEQLGFSGFRGKVVADIGTRDGRFVPLFRDLGAKEVYGIDPDNEALKEAIAKGVLDGEHALPVKFQEIPEEIQKRIQVVTIFNFSIPLSEQDAIFNQIATNLPDNVEIVMTFAENVTYTNALHNIFKYFEINAPQWDSSESASSETGVPHKIFVVCKKKSKN